MMKLHLMVAFVLLLSLKLSSGFDLAGLMRTKTEDSTVDSPIITDVVADVISSKEIETGQYIF